jgi:hypothetical protein
MKTKFRTVTIDNARGQVAAGLINDFMMQRIADGWGILLLEVGESQSLLAVTRNEADPSDEDGCIFPTADSALGIVYEIGFDISTRAIGLWRHDPKHMERILNEAQEALRRSA